MSLDGTCLRVLICLVLLSGVSRAEEQKTPGPVERVGPDGIRRRAPTVADAVCHASVCSVAPRAANGTKVMPSWNEAL